MTRARGMYRRMVITLWWLGLALGAGCSGDPSRPAVLVLATTTSTRDSGLLDVLIPQFTEATGIEVKVVAVGSGQALEMGRRGDADVLLTHAPAAEKSFLAEAYGESRREVFCNDFVVVGPMDDPAEVKGLDSVQEVVRRIADRQATFVSRGDESGTHLHEKTLWSRVGIAPQGDWYLSAGDGMAATLRLANEKRGYTLADRGTFLSQRDRLDLAILAEGDPSLHNVYSVIVVSPAKHPHAHVEEARRLADFLAAPDTQALIGRFGVEKWGQALFFPRAAAPSR